MKTLGIIAASFLAVIVAAIIAYKTAYPTYTYRYRMTIAIEADGKIHAGSSVIEVKYIKQPAPLPEMAPFRTEVHGQAVLIDLGSRGVVIATLKGPGSIAEYLALRAYGLDSQDGYSKIPQQSGRRNLALDNMPSLIWFSDIADPNTARVVSIFTIPELFGPNARLTEAYVEIARDPVVVDIDKKLPWYRALADSQKRGITGQSGQFQLTYTMFIGAGS